MENEQEYDVVIDALQVRIDTLQHMVNQNMEIGMFNVMDQIRLEQIDKLKEAQQLWITTNET
jgi:hypothetical protein